jgi:hypothetical protein
MELTDHCTAHGILNAVNWLDVFGAQALCPVRQKDFIRASNHRLWRFQRWGKKAFNFFAVLVIETKDLAYARQVNY